ncbi:hypothetical protein [Desulfobacula sp.]|uniref:hypothetical protein n=1 Tax=Desulfobacula sp. TaxID=2593537 RepID=UPI0026380AB1|nr:hypothetical protein [Desulfobacula sp.]
MEYGLGKEQLLDIMAEWNRFLKRRVHLIACGGTAMTLLGVKPSTKDVDFMIPNIKEFTYLTKLLKALGYKQTTGSGWKRNKEIFRFDLFSGNHIHTTELLDSPLEDDRNSALKEYSHLYIGILNDYDLICSKLMRGTRVDFEDCLMLFDAHKEKIDIAQLTEHFNELLLYEVAEVRLKPNMDYFLDQLRENGLYG